MKLLTLGYVLLTLSLSCEEPSSLSEQKVSSLIYYNAYGLQQVKERITEGADYYTSAYEKLIESADEALDLDPNPVVNKNRTPPSGDKHDYLSLGPYWWPNYETEDGLPWIRRDGEINPLTRGDDTDKNRLSTIWNALEYLSFAFYYSEDDKYANKVMELIDIWFVADSTKVNPNVNFGQGVPGINDGRPFGIIEWRGIEKVVTTLQLLEDGDVLDEELAEQTKEWLAAYLDWLLNSKLGKEEGDRPNNHANWYDYQVLGLQLYLGQREAAKRGAEDIKRKRIATQIEPDGSQPHELERTKSLSYSTMNLKAMVLNAMLAQQIGIDLLNYETKDGRSLRQAAEFLKPYATKEKEWTLPQIDGWEKTVDSRLLPFFSVMSSIYGKPLLEDTAAMKQSLGDMERLQFPPLLYE